MIKKISLLAIAGLTLASCGDAGVADMDNDGVVVTVNGITEAGTVYVALQNEGVFGAADATYGAAVESDGSGSVDVVIDDVSAGDYAIAVFQDTNGNGRMDMEGGVPSEPWALSNGAGTRGAPVFADSMMSMTGQGDKATITLN